MTARYWGTLGGLWGESTDEALYPAYHVVLGGQGLMLAQGGYERARANQFAAKLSTAGTTQNDRIGDQTLLMNDWSGGDGLLHHGSLTTTDRYRRGAGINVYDEAGAVGLGPYMAAPAALQTSFNSVTAMAVWRHLLMIGRNDGKLYSWDGSSLALIGDTAKTTGGITALGTIEDNLYVGNGQDNGIWRYETTFASNHTVGPWVGPGPVSHPVTGVFALVGDLRNGAIRGFYAAYAGATGLVGKTVETSSVADPMTDPDELITLGVTMRVLLYLNETLIAVGSNPSDRQSRMYSANVSSGNLSWTHRGSLRDAVITCGTVMDGVAYFGDSIQGRIWRYDGSRLSILHQIGSDLVPYTTPITGIASWRGALWVGIKDTDGTCALLRIEADGTRSRPVTGLSGTTPGLLAVYQDQLYYVTNTTGATRVFRTNGTFAAAGNVETPLLNASLSGTSKQWLGVQVNHSALISGQSVQVQYQLDDAGAWVTLGTSNTVGAISADFDFPAAVNADQIGFKLLLAGAAGSSTQLRVFSLVPRYRPAPDSLREWTLRVQMRGTTERPMVLADGTEDERTGEEISEQIWSLIEDDAPVAFLDIDRTEYTVTISDWSEHLHPATIQAGATSIGWELEGQLHLREGAQS